MAIDSKKVENFVKNFVKTFGELVINLHTLLFVSTLALFKDGTMAIVGCNSILKGDLSSGKSAMCNQVILVHHKIIFLTVKASNTPLRCGGHSKFRCFHLLSQTVKKNSIKTDCSGGQVQVIFKSDANQKASFQTSGEDPALLLWQKQSKNIAAIFDFRDFRF